MTKDPKGVSVVVEAEDFFSFKSINTGPVVISTNLIGAKN